MSSFTFPKQQSTQNQTKLIRYFFISGIVTILTLGCMWGAINLLIIGTESSFHGVNYSWILAHGHAIVWGFVGFFIMGFSYHILPRFKGTSLWNPKLAFSTLPLMITGILLQTVAHLGAPKMGYMIMGVVAGIIQLVALVFFAVIMVRTFRQSTQSNTFDPFVYSALFWIIIAAIANPIIFWLFEGAVDKDAFLFYVKTFNIPYRDIQLLGVPTVLILGISTKIIPSHYGNPLSKRWLNFMVWGLNAAVVIGVATFIGAMLSDVHWWHAVSVISYILLLVIAIGTPIKYGLFKKNLQFENDRSLKFFRAAFFWFIIAMILLAFGPYYMFGIYIPMTGLANPFSHAYFGAYRHALTVGFVTMMILAVSSKIVPKISGTNPNTLNSLWLAFILINLGNTLRISIQIATDFFPEAFNFIGVSGFIEVTGLAIWGYEMIRNMRSGLKSKTKVEIDFQKHNLMYNPVK